MGIQCREVLTYCRLQVHKCEVRPSYNKRRLLARVEGASGKMLASTSLANVSMSLVRDNATNALRPWISVIDSTALTYTGDLKYADDINGNAFARPPDIMLPTPPTESETVELFRLSRYQAIAFRKVVRTLDAERRATCVEVRAHMLIAPLHILV